MTTAHEFWQDQFSEYDIPAWTLVELPNIRVDIASRQRRFGITVEDWCFRDNFTGQYAIGKKIRVLTDSGVECFNRSSVFVVDLSEESKKV